MMWRFSPVRVIKVTKSYYTARIVTNSSYGEAAKKLIKVLKWPAVEDTIKLETATMVFKSRNGLVPIYISNSFTESSTREVQHVINSETDLLPP